MLLQNTNECATDVSSAAAAPTAVPFPGADASVVRRTQAALSKAGERAVHFVARCVSQLDWCCMATPLAVQAAAMQNLSCGSA